MGRTVDFEGSNITLKPPEGMEEEIATMKAFYGNGQFVSCWELSMDELEEVNKTGKVWLSLSGNFVQPSFVGSETEVLALLFQNSDDL